MALAVSDYGTASTYSTTGTALAASWHSGVAPTSGLLMLAVSMVSGSLLFTAPSGWSTLFNDDAADTTYNGFGVFYKVAGASEPTSVSFALAAGTTGKHECVAMISIAGANTSLTPQFAQSTASSSPLSTGSLTPAAWGSMVVGLFGCDTATALSTASGYTSQAAINDTSGTPIAVMIETINTLTSQITSGVSISCAASGGTVGQFNSGIVIVAPATASDPINITDTRATISDSPSLALSHSSAISDTRAAVSDTPSIGITHYLNVADTRSAISDSLTLVDTPATPLPFAISDTRPLFYDNLLMVIGHNEQLADSRGAASDSPAVLRFIYPFQPAIGNGHYTNNAAGNGMSIAANGAYGNGSAGEA